MGAYRPVAEPAAGVVRPRELRVEQRPLDPSESVDMHLVVEVDPERALLAGAHLARADASPCAGGVVPARLEVVPRKGEAVLDFRAEDLAPARLLEEPTVLDVTVVAPGGAPTCLRVPVLDDEHGWTRERSRRFGGLALRFMGVVAGEVDGERLMRIDLELGHAGWRLGAFRVGFEAFLSALIHGQADPMGGFAGDLETRSLWGLAPFVHVPLARFRRFAIGPSLAYEVTAGFDEPHVFHGPRVGLRVHILAPPFSRRGFHGPTENLSFAVEVTTGTLGVGAELPRHPTLGVGLIVESF